MTNEKIFIIGFNKIATKSFHKFFVHNNIKSVHFHAFRISDGRHIIPKPLRANNDITNRHMSLANYFLYNKSKNKPLLHGLDEDIVCFSDMTDDATATDAKDFYKQLDIENPNSKFILNIRNVDDWIKSRTNHTCSGLLNKHCKFYDCTKEEVIKIWKKIYFAHIEDVKKYFKNREKDLLIYDIDKDQPEKIQRFLKEKYTFDLSLFKHTHKTKK